MGKCSIYFGGVSSTEGDRIIHRTDVFAEQLPFKYLVIPFSTKKILIIQWTPLVEKIAARIFT